MRTVKTARSRYLESVFSKEDAVLKRIRCHSEKNNTAYMQISAYEGGILQFLCRALKVKTAVEIGTLYGYSSLMIARALPAGGRLYTLDLSRQRQREAQNLMKDDSAAKKIEFIPGEALKSLQVLSRAAPFDMVFIDADKASYLKYLHWSTRNLKPGGLLAADNTFLFGAVYGEPSKKEPLSSKALQVMKQFNKDIQKHYISALIPTAEGLTAGIKK